MTNLENGDQQVPLLVYMVNFLQLLQMFYKCVELLAEDVETVAQYIPKTRLRMIMILYHLTNAKSSFHLKKKIFPNAFPMVNFQK